MENKATTAKLILVSILFLLMLSYPVLSIPNRPGPLSKGLFLYVFAVWAILIAMVYFLTRPLSDKKESNE